MTDYISRDEALTALETSYREKPFTDAVEIIRSLPAAAPELGRSGLDNQINQIKERRRLLLKMNGDEECIATLDWVLEVLDSPSLETPEAKVLLTGPTINWAVEYTKLQSHVMKYISELTGWSINEIPFPGPSLETRECGHEMKVVVWSADHKHKIGVRAEPYTSKFCPDCGAALDDKGER